MFGTDLSLSFRLFGIPIRVSLFFLVMALLLGRGFTRGSVPMMVAWVGIVFVSVLLHELGHAFTARVFGQQPFISLHAMGGLTTWRVREPLTAGRRFAVALAGPAAGIGLAVVAALVGGLFFERGTVGRTITTQIAVVNLFWGVLNLIPMLPLDGGSITAAVFDLLAPGRGRRAANYVSVVTALAVGALSLVSGMFVFAL
ncbi:MAG TPA: site-2 protease family protein, partial [Vicinamibacteria bacterium]|nr:site-2 protease family protein [Vicinamibacteria bacterium]